MNGLGALSRLAIPRQSTEMVYLPCFPHFPGCFPPRHRSRYQHSLASTRLQSPGFLGRPCTWADSQVAVAVSTFAAASALLPTPPFPLSAVDESIGTGSSGWGVGHLNPGAQHPFGAMRLGPDTSFDDSHARVLHFSGYYYRYALAIRRPFPCPATVDAA